MSANWKSEIKWLLSIGVVALALTFGVLYLYQKINWFLSFHYSFLVWILWIFISLFCFTGGMIYFIRFLLHKKNNRIKSQLTLIFLSISIIGFYRIVKVVYAFEFYFMPTSEKSDVGFTIYPPMATTNEVQSELLLGSMYPFEIGYILMSLMITLLIITVLITLKRKKY